MTLTPNGYVFLGLTGHASAPDEDADLKTAGKGAR